MGVMIEASCPCGYKSDTLFVGGGYLDFTTIDKEPAYCSQCKRLVLANYLKPRQKCRKCSTPLIWYNDSRLYRKCNESKTEEIYAWDDFSLPQAQFLCPQCGNVTMEFINVGCWD